MNKSQITKIIVALVLLLAGLRFLSFCSRRSGSAPEAARHYRVLGTVTAAETANRFGSDISGLLVIDASDSPHLQERERGFRAAARELGLTLAGVVQTQAGDSHPELGWNQNFYRRITSEYPDVSVIVSFAGLPPAQLVRSPRDRLHRGEFVAVLPAAEFLDSFLRSGLVSFAILPAYTAPNETLTTKVPDRVWFDSYYRLVDTARNNGESTAPLPSSLEEEQVEIIDDHLGPVSF